MYELVIAQLKILTEVVSECNSNVHHVKPHGALYNMAARDASLAKAIACAVVDFRPTLVLYGLSGSHLIDEAKRMGLTTASEVFADRTYRDDGRLTPRTEPDALIHSEQQSIEQVVRMIKKGKVISGSGQEISITAETVCVHGDGKNAVAFARSITKRLKTENVRLKAIEIPLNK